MNTYKAPKPKQTTWQKAQYIGLRLLFLPLLLWDLARLILTALFGKLIGKIVLPAQRMDFSAYRIQNPETLNTSTLRHEQHKVITFDSAELDTLEIKPLALKDVPIANQKYVIHLVGNASSYEQCIREMQEDAEELTANVVGFNYRGVSLSSGAPKKSGDLITDGIAQVQRLLDQGVSPENITLKGHSLGGGIACVVARYFHRHHQKINVFDHCSFSSIENFLIGHIRRSRNTTGHQATTGGKILGWLAVPPLFLALNLSRWEINAAKAYKAIPKEYRDYVLIRTPKKGRNSTTPDDPVVTHYASLHRALKSERRSKKGSEKALAKQRKMTPTHASPNAHDLPLRDLKNRSGTSGSAFFKAFVQHSYQDHGIRGPRLL